MSSKDCAKEIQGVLASLERALASSDSAAAQALFAEDCYWRDMVSFTWNLITLSGRDQIRDMLEARLDDVQPSSWTVETWPEPYGDSGQAEGYIRFETAQAHGYGYIRLKDGRIWTLLTTMEQLRGHEEPGWASRPFGLVQGEQIGQPTWADRRSAEASELGISEQPYVLIVGGGHSGIILGARLRQLGVPALIVEANPRAGDNWRKRYKTLQLHNPVWENHLPYLPFPDGWPVYVNKDKFADWLESYTKVMELNYWGSTWARAAEYDSASGTWSVDVDRDGEIVTLHPAHLVLATGTHARPSLPDVPGRDVFQGVQEHSSEHVGPDAFMGKKVIVVGSGTSSHDIAAAMAVRGIDVTMIQRSPTYVVKPDRFNEFVIGPLYSQQAEDRGVTAERGDILGASIPYDLFYEFQKPGVDRIRELDAEFYEELGKTGYLLDYGPHGAGLFARALTGVNNYYIDVGAADMIISGQLKVESGSGIDHLTEHSMVLTDGREIQADAIVYATGYTSMRGAVAELISEEVADRVGPVWGLGSGFPKDPGPWEGEIRNMWKPVAQEGLWFHGSLIAHSRSFSRYLAQQLKARMEGIPTPVYTHPGSTASDAEHQPGAGDPQRHGLETTETSL